MRLIRFGRPGAERPGLLLADGTRRDASALTRDYDEEFFAADGMQELARWAAQDAAAAPRVAEDERWAPPVSRPSKIICVGLNYRDHAAESGQPVPQEPVLFMKATSAISGPYDDIRIPPGSQKTDWEVELAIVIGRRASHVSEPEAAAHIAGFTILNDVSEREYQIEHCGQWVKGKSCDSFAPLGPALVTPDEAGDPADLALWLEVNGRRCQDSSTAQMVFGVPFLVSYISRFMSLLPGDVISTGTPPGVGMGARPPRFLQAGDVVELGIQGLGTQRQRAVPWDA